MIINCWNENEKCDDCGTSPVQFIEFDNFDDEKTKRYCIECFSKMQKKEIKDENK